MNFILPTLIRASSCWKSTPRLLPAEEVKAFTSRVRSWAEADGGCPVYMFNLIHFLPQFRTFPGAPEFKETLKEANAYYEKSIMWPGASVSQAGGWRI